MDTTMSEVVQFIQENDVKFIRLAFCDIFGNQKNIAIMPTELERAFEQGIHFNAAALRGFLNVEASDPVSYTHLAATSVQPTSIDVASSMISIFNNPLEIEMACTSPFF